MANKRIISISERVARFSAQLVVCFLKENKGGNGVSKSERFPLFITLP